MKKLLLPVAFALALASFSAVQAQSQDSVADGKALGANVAGQLRGQAFQVDENGEVKKGADGKPLTQSNSANSLRDAGRMYNSMSGVESMERQGSPARGRNAAGKAAVAVNDSFDFSCVSINPEKPYSAGGLVFRIEGCQGTVTSVQAAQVSACDNTLEAGLCATVADFDQRFMLPTNQFSNFNGLQLGLGCNSQAQCRMTIKGSYSFGGNGDELKTKSEQAGANADGNGSLVGSLRTAVTQGDYAGKMQEYGQPIIDCQKLNENALANGEAKTCDGKQSVAVASGQNAAASNCPQAKCIREGSSTQTFKRSCVRTFPLTVRTTVRQYSETLECSVNAVLARDGSNNELSRTNSCDRKDAEGKPLPSASEGLTLVGQSPFVCTETYAIGDSSEGCAAGQYTQYFVKTSGAATVAETASPAPVGGACDTNPLSETRVSSCDSSWFGRTLDNDQCSLTFSYDDGSQVSLPVDYTQKAGCGFCMRPSESVTCYAVPQKQEDVDNSDTLADAEDSCEGVVSDTSCRLVKAEPLEFSGEGGLVSAQREEYSCGKTTTSCLEYERSTDASCLNGNTFGLDNARNAPQNDASFNAALVAAATVDGTAKGVEGTQAQMTPKIFGGSDQRCRRPAGGIGSLLSRNCCRTNLERPKKGRLIQKGCDEADVRLAAARRSNYAHYIGEYCSKKVGLFRLCIERKQTYCVFPGVLARLVQEQGREQLNAMVASGGSGDAQRGSISFSYYDSGNGSWAPVQTVNGVQVTAWQHPSYCADPGKAQEILLKDPTAKGCPGMVSVTFAACSASSGCEALPKEPEEGSMDWNLVTVNPLDNLTTAVNRYAVVTGACSTTSQSCRYDISAYPAGKGGRAMVSRDLTWQLYADTALLPGQEGTASPDQYQMNNIGDLMFKGYSATGAGKTMPATVRVDMSSNGGASFTTYQVPTDLKGREQTLGGDVRITGYCDLMTNICGYRVTGTMTVTAKPWGDAKNPDCSGFSPGQLSALDFGKMDLSEWLATVMDKDSLNSQNPSALVAQANSQMQEYNAMFNNGERPTMRMSSPTSANFARMVPAEGFGPFEAKLAVSGMWPEFTGRPEDDKNEVQYIDVDWGDCSPVQASIAPNVTMDGRGFRLTHRYEAPDNDKHACLKRDPTDRLERNLVHTVTITAYTKLSGKQTAKLKVENAWAKYPGTAGNNAYVGSGSSATVGGNTPPPPTPPKP